jgi:transcriptional regulator GlxA family with amidase domain
MAPDGKGRGRAIMDSPHPAPRRVGFVLVEGFALMSAAAAVEPLRAANLLAGRPLYEPVFLAERPGWVAASCGAGFQALGLAARPPDCALVFVIAGGDPLARDLRGLERALRGLAQAGVTLGGISGGAVPLARAGLMRGRRFTVHWEHFEALRALSDDFLMERRLYVIDRDRFTCAGGTAPLDMMHALIAADHGAALAGAVSDWFIHTGIRQADAPQRTGPTPAGAATHPAVAAALELMDSHIGDPLSLDQIAALAGLGRRQLQRLFLDHLGRTVMAAYRDMRLEVADRLLRQSPMSVLDVAMATGFADAGHFARVYKARFGIAPATRRRRARVSLSPRPPPPGRPR